MAELRSSLLTMFGDGPPLRWARRARGQPADGFKADLGGNRTPYGAKLR